jgi:Integrase core domain
VERFHGSLARALQKRGPVAGEQAAWLERFRWEYNDVRPHQALGMKTPASVWTRSERRYDPLQPAWVYPEGRWTLKVDCQGKLISAANAGRWERPSRANACASSRWNNACWSSTAPP